MLKTKKPERAVGAGTVRGGEPSLAHLGCQAGSQLLSPAISFSTNGLLFLQCATVTQHWKKMVKRLLIQKRCFIGIYIGKNAPANYWPQNIGYLTLSILISNFRKQIYIFVSCHVKNELLAQKATQNIVAFLHG